MKKNNFKEIIDDELSLIVLNDEVRNKIKENAGRRKQHNLLRRFAACVAVVVLGSSTVVAGYYVMNKISVNDTVLPGLDDMDIVIANEINGNKDEYGRVEKDVEDYNKVKQELGIHLLDSELSGDNPYMQVHINTDNKDFIIIAIENFILGDTSNYQYIEQENRYAYDHGIQFYSPISLSIDIILSEEQLNNGWDTDYLGMYEFVENYTSVQGYKVNIVEDTIDDETVENYISEKCAVLVADGIRYTLKGRVSMDTIKSVIDTLE